MSDDAESMNCQSRGSSKVYVSADLLRGIQDASTFNPYQTVKSSGFVVYTLLGGGYLNGN